ncbi:unnamed protein product [Lactuca saligna]|uniref:Reverse transcriptase zinc-binding domain-containing protein n=1 Tax=Lactuca saligna TaxID=75948 RepID=A0AA36EMU5_LACSI|nr:unnamed protein product [Lactuca saligna]
MVWINLVPSKVGCFVWRACLNRILTLVVLAKRRLNVPSTSCQLCNNGDDDTNHVLVKCPSLKTALDWIFRWCDIQVQHFNSVTKLVSFAIQWGQCPKKRKILLAIIYSFLWFGWKARNDKIFNNLKISSMVLADNTINLLFNWVNHRGTFENCKWVVCSCNLFRIL